MTIEKNGMIYTVKENAASWSLTASTGKVTVEYSVKKADCPTLDALKEFILERDAL